MMFSETAGGSFLRRPGPRFPSATGFGVCGVFNVDLVLEKSIRDPLFRRFRGSIGLPSLSIVDLAQWLVRVWKGKDRRVRYKDVSMRKAQVGKEEFTGVHS